MNKYLLFGAMAVTVLSMSAEDHFMHIHKADGTVQVIKITDVDKITFETEGDIPVVTGDKMVDMGLSVKWAAWNVGATEPSDYGNFYAYGEIEPKTDYSEATYQWFNPDYSEDQFMDEWEKYYKLGRDRKSVV